MTTVAREPDELWVPVTEERGAPQYAPRTPDASLGDVVATVVAGATLMFLLGYVVGRAVGSADA